MVAGPGTDRTHGGRAIKESPRRRFGNSYIF